jgi:hypothetical protein
MLPEGFEPSFTRRRRAMLVLTTLREPMRPVGFEPTPVDRESAIIARARQQAHTGTVRFERTTNGSEARRIVLTILRAQRPRRDLNA